MQAHRYGDDGLSALLEWVPEDEFDRLQEVEVVGESHRQDVLAGLAGPKEADGKRFGCGVTLRCDPTNEYDGNAVHVEVCGQLVGYVSRQVAGTLCPYLHEHHGGVLECHGVIVGGWKDRSREGHYGIRVWTAHLPTGFLPAPRPYQNTGGRRVERDTSIAYPALPPPSPDEQRLTPTLEQLEDDRWGSEVTVICEEHYQATISAALPAGWDERSVPLVVELALAASNPHVRQPIPVIEIRVNGSTAGYFTPKMTARYEGVIRASFEQRKRPTAVAHARVATKGGTKLWRLKVLLPNE